MSYILSGLKVAVPARANRPREKSRPAPGKTTSSTALATRMLRPRTPTDPGKAQPHLAKVRSLKLQQAACERQLVALQKTLAGCKDKATCLGIKKNIAKLVVRIKALAAAADREALAAVEKGAAPTAVKSVAADASKTSSVTPVIEASTAELRPDGTVKVSADATIVSTPVTSDPGSALPAAVAASPSSGDVAAPDDVVALEDGGSEGLSAPVMVGLGLGALFLLSRMVK